MTGRLDMALRSSMQKWPPIAAIAATSHPPALNWSM